jgi:hypothetical protein
MTALVDVQTHPSSFDFSLFEPFDLAMELFDGLLERGVFLHELFEPGRVRVPDRCTFANTFIRWLGAPWVARFCGWRGHRSGLRAENSVITRFDRERTIALGKNDGAERRFTRLQHALALARYPDHGYQEQSHDCRNDEKRSQGILKAKAKTSAYLHVHGSVDSCRDREAAKKRTENRNRPVRT